MQWDENLTNGNTFFSLQVLLRITPLMSPFPTAFRGFLRSECVDWLSGDCGAALEAISSNAIQSMLSVLPGLKLPIFRGIFCGTAKAAPIQSLLMGSFPSHARGSGGPHDSRPGERRSRYISYRSET